jgi:hypothetical protein
VSRSEGDPTGFKNPSRRITQVTSILSSYFFFLALIIPVSVLLSI